MFKRLGDPTGGAGLPDFDLHRTADMIGTTRSRVSFFMNKFRKLGFLTYNGKIHVNNSLLNAVLHNKPGQSAGGEV